ncbi:hypothetical protein EBZ37_08675 [bacterium]|nr:hypothetical protein [bacterium]
MRPNRERAREFDRKRAREFDRKRAREFDKKEFDRKSLTEIDQKKEMELLRVRVGQEAEFKSCWVFMGVFMQADELLEAPSRPMDEVLAIRDRRSGQPSSLNLTETKLQEAFSQILGFLWRRRRRLLLEWPWLEGQGGRFPIELALQICDRDVPYPGSSLTWCPLLETQPRYPGRARFVYLSERRPGDMQSSAKMATPTAGKKRKLDASHPAGH